MKKDKNKPDEMLKKYISSEIEIIKKEKSISKNWRRNDEFHSQITIRSEEDK